MGITDDLFDISGKTAVVTGGSSGIGLMIATGFVEAGARVIISSRKADVCAQVADELNALAAESGRFTDLEQRPAAIAIPADLSTEAACAELARAVMETTGGRLDILVNNAGATWGAPFDDHDDAAWDRVLDLNVKGVFHLTRFLHEALRAAATPEDPARVINIGSVDGIHVPTLETYSYTAAKAAVHQVTRAMAKRLGPEHITVNAIAPGPFQSRMMRATLEVAGDAIAASIPLRRIGSDADMAGTAIFLASRAGAYVNAAIIPVDGGMVGTL